jgi:hypothetical protein
MPLELIVGAAVGAAAANPTVRKTIRQGMIRGLGGLLVAYDKVAAFAHEAAKGARNGAAAADTKPATATAADARPAAPQETAQSAPSAT